MKNLSNNNILHVTKDGEQYLQFRRLMEFDDVISHAYSLDTSMNFRTAKADKSELSKEEFKISVESYKKICNFIDEDYINVIKANQNHTDNVQIVNKKIKQGFMDINLKQYDNTDGLITNMKHFILSTTNADCILMLFFDPKTRTIANVHSGWRGTLQRISIKTVDKMQKEFNCNPEDIICCICPSIRKCHFEVDLDVKEMFEKEFHNLDNKHLEQIIEKKNNKEKWNIDTVLINKIILEKRGLKKENIIDSEICSVCNSDLIHSYRVEKQGYGLSTAIISLK